MNLKATAILPILARLQGRTRMDNHPNKTARQHNKAAVSYTHLTLPTTPYV